MRRVLIEGAVDGSAGADVGGGFFVGASDEKNNFRLYNAKGGLPARKLDVGVEPAVKSALGLGKIKECDLEGAAKIGDLIFWIGSHGRNEAAKEKKERQVLFATNLTGVGKDAKLEIIGKVYSIRVGRTKTLFGACGFSKWARRQQERTSPAEGGTRPPGALRRHTRLRYLKSAPSALVKSSPFATANFRLEP